MVAWLRTYIQNIIIVIILASFMQIILPSGTVRRYAQLAVGLVLVLTLLSPLLALARAPFGISELLGQATVQTAWAELRTESTLLKNSQDRQLLTAYELALKQEASRVIATQGGLQLVEATFEFVTEREAEDFGRIKQMQVVVSQGSGVQPVTAVKPVQIGPASGPKPREGASPVDSALITRLKSALATHFAINTDQVLITIR